MLLCFGEALVGIASVDDDIGEFILPTEPGPILIRTFASIAAIAKTVGRKWDITLQDEVEVRGEHLRVANEGVGAGTEARFDVRETPVSHRRKQIRVLDDVASLFLMRQSLQTGLPSPDGTHRVRSDVLTGRLQIDSGKFLDPFTV
jgi:hypothetical protein